MDLLIFSIWLTVLDFSKCYMHVLNETESKKYDDHLKYEHIRSICENRDSICVSNDTKICAVRKSNKKIEFMDFLNACYLFLSNMCDNPSREYFIAWSDTCDMYKKTRRTDVWGNGTNIHNETKLNTSTKKNILRQDKKNEKTTTPFEPLYEVETAADSHICPLSCPNVYLPECFSVNRGYGKYFKLFTFVNHCSGDLYYCKNWREFKPPPGETEMIRSSGLGWSFCGAARYLQFARFSEAASSLGHYGWLAGNYKYTHILEPNERIPGYG